MRNLAVVLTGCLLSSSALAQDAKSAIEKWRACADAAAARYSQSTESAPVVARLAALACDAEKKQTVEAVEKRDGPRFADEYVETVERRYIDRLSVDVMERRLRQK